MSTRWLPWLPAATKSAPGASVTVRFTSRFEAGAGLARTVNVAVAPSVTGEVTAVMVTTGVAGGGLSLSFTVTDAAAGEPTV